MTASNSSTRRVSPGAILPLLASVVIGVGAFGAAPAEARQVQDRGGPTVGLALSGGVAKGFAHVGVLRALEEAGVRVDVVSGTSMGSVIGALYAIGVAADSIEGIVTAVDWGLLVRDEAERDRRFLQQRRFDDRAVLTFPIEGGSVGLPSGAIAGSNMVRLLEQALWPAAAIRDFSELPRPFVAVATDLETGEPVTLRGGVLTEALRASTSIPGAFEPFTLDGRLLVDGALSRNLPASDARDLGAEIVICSDVSDPLESAESLRTLVDVIDQVWTLSMRREVLEQRAYCDVLVRPDVLGISGFAFERVEEWIERGSVAAEPHIGTFESIARRQRGSTTVTAPESFLADSVRIDRVEIRGTSRELTAALVQRELRVEGGSFVSRESLDERLADIDATGLFGLVRYRLDVQDDGATVTVDVEERPNDRLGIGLRYDEDRRAALLFTGTLHNLVRYGSVVRLDLRVGQETKIGASYVRRHGVTGRLGGSTSASWSQGLIRLPTGARIATDFEMSHASSFFGLVGGRSTFLGAGVIGEWAQSDDLTVPDVWIGSAAAVFEHESLDRIDFPRSGLDATARWEWGVSEVASGGDFTVLTASARLFLPVHPRVTIELGGDLGVADGSDLPVHRTFFLGGSHRSAVFGHTQPTFHGFDSQHLTGTALQVGRVGVRWELRSGLHLGVGVDFGGTADAWQFPLDEGHAGVGIRLGTDTLVGPVWLEWSKASGGLSGRLSINFGRAF